MSNYIYTEEMRTAHPSICQKCKKARKVAAEELAKEGWIGCKSQFDRPTDCYDTEKHIQDLINHARLKEAALGWVMPIRLDDNELRDSSMTNQVLMTKEVTMCPYFEAETAETPAEPTKASQAPRQDKEVKLSVIPEGKLIRYLQEMKKKPFTTKVLCDCGKLADITPVPYAFDKENNDIWFAAICPHCGELILTKE